MKHKMMSLSQKRKNKIKQITLDSLKESIKILPIFLLAVLVGVLIEMFIPDKIVYSLLGKNILIAIPLAAIVGVMLPIPRYATYPIAFALLDKGASYGVILALICGEVIGGSFIREALEIKLLGIRFFTARFILSIFFIILAGFAIEILI